MTYRLKVTAFWNEFHTAYPNERVYRWMDAVANNEVDWFRELGLTSVAISDHCKIGRFGFDQDKYEAGKDFVLNLLEKYELSGIMQW